MVPGGLNKVVLSCCLLLSVVCADSRPEDPSSHARGDGGRHREEARAERLGQRVSAHLSPQVTAHAGGVGPRGRLSGLGFLSAPVISWAPRRCPRALLHSCESGETHAAAPHLRARSRRAPNVRRRGQPECQAGEFVPRQAAAPCSGIRPAAAWGFGSAWL